MNGQRVGNPVKSATVIANAWHRRSDALSSIPPVITVIIATANPACGFVNAIGTLVISLFILKVSWDIIWPALSELVDRGVTEETRQRMSSFTWNPRKRTDPDSQRHPINRNRHGSISMLSLRLDLR